jgi:hypothetical protein
MKIGERFEYPEEQRCSSSPRSIRGDDERLGERRAYAAEVELRLTVAAARSRIEKRSE